ncbi:SAM-dependent methyltransferase [Vibrio sp. UCD-FRSSP16_10]|uniref:methyltransferase n=1 Tax=unclassified Vibrio TaxID=2614977 RepID=UPI0007FD77F6|nr:MULTISPECIES: methyltransferase [unclassified Vibrio]OBT15922.1 SAM-dependent methyltransferase [Vibrio sp. UCD-FRSSP16_10]OBT17816.1 SAM-dependent methyltransferase [Vibrio sp. UCD-FRSSP16_30]
MRTQFTVLDQLLFEHQHFWRFEPFHESYAVNHRFSNTVLGDWLDGLSAQQVQHFKQDVSSLNVQLSELLPQLNKLNTLCQIDQHDVKSLDLDARLVSGIPGRKLSQISAMGAQALNTHSGNQWLEWCAGKGFLGRILAQQSQQAVTSFEWQGPLCEHGQAEADKQELPVTFVQGDAFNCDHQKVFKPNQHAVALHACGDLHVSLMKHAIDYRLPALSIAPCCYHLIQDNAYQPVSAVAQNAQIHLSKPELRIPLQETVTGGERVLRHRFLEMSYRLGLDELLTEELDFKEYQPIPSIKKSLLQEGFKAFCDWAANKKGFSLPDCDFAAYQLKGEQRFQRMEKLSLIQMAFHRPLEMWLIFDKSLFLIENGYKVTVSEFCSKSVTPRNILIHAKREVGSF